MASTGGGGSLQGLLGPADTSQLTAGSRRHRDQAEQAQGLHPAQAGHLKDTFRRLEATGACRRVHEISLRGLAAPQELNAA